MRRLAALALAASLAACGSTEEFAKRAQSFVGWTEAALVSRLGPPNNVYGGDANSAGGVKLLTWTRGDSGVIPGYMNCSRWSCFYIPPTQYTNACSLTYTITAGVVTAWRAEGNSCRA